MVVSGSIFNMMKLIECKFAFSRGKGTCVILRYHETKNKSIHSHLKMGVLKKAHTNYFNKMVGPVKMTMVRKKKLHALIVRSYLLVVKRP